MRSFADLSLCCERYTLCWLLVVLLVHSSDDYIINSTSDDKSAGLFLYFIFIIHSLRIHQKCTRVCVVFFWHILRSCPLFIFCRHFFFSISTALDVSFDQLSETCRLVRWLTISFFFHLLSSSGSHHIHTVHLFIHIVDSVDAVAGYKLWNSQYIWKCASTRVVFAALQISLYFSLAVFFPPNLSLLKHEALQKTRW